MTLQQLQRLAHYARNEENKLRAAFGRFSPLIELEVTPDGLSVKCGAWSDDERVFQSGALVRWHDVTEATAIEAVNNCADSMNTILSKESKR
jgi:hypothetical protein